MSGLAPQMPRLATIFVMAGLASLGLPGMAGFIAEFTVFIGSYGPWSAYTILGAVGDRHDRRIHSLDDAARVLRA